MKQLLTILAFAFFMLMSCQLWAQPDKPLPDREPEEVLTLEEAVAIALEENNNIVIAGNEAQQALNDATPGNAGLLPTLRLNGGYQRQNQNTNIQFASPQQEPIDRTNATSETWNASVELAYNVFGGLGKYYRFQSLQNLSRTGNVQSRLQIESTLIRLINTYMDVSRLRENMQALQEAVEVSRQRLLRLANRYDYGGTTKLEVLNAKVDLNSDSINLVQTVKDLANSKRSLCVLMGIQPETDFKVVTRFVIDDALELENLKQRARTNNASLVVARLQSENSDLRLQQARAGYYPSLDLSLSYGYNEQQNEAGFVSSQKSYGWSGGVNFSWPIFDGFTRRAEVENARLGLLNDQANAKQARLQVLRDVENTYTDYEYNLYLLELIEDDIETARLNFERSQSAFRTGQINSTEFRQAQLQLIQARVRASELKIQAKRAELELYRLGGLLITRQKE